MSTTTLFIGQKNIHFKNIDSTNQKAVELLKTEKLPEGTVISCDFQEVGKGQMGTKWETEAGKNITLSIILHPTFLPIKNQFIFNKVIALAVKETCKEILNTKEEVCIKWPNDIYYIDKKIAGILIENTLTQNIIKQSIVGIGINVNQSVFPAQLDNAISCKQITKQEFDLNNIKKILFKHIEKWYLALKNKRFNLIDESFLIHLYQYKKAHQFLISGSNQSIIGTIEGITEEGKLIVQTKEKIYTFSLKEVSY